MVSDQPPEDLLALAQRHVVEGEARVARQQEILATLRGHGHAAAAMRGEAVLVQMRIALDLGRRHLAFEIEKQSLPARVPADPRRPG
jgi:hypothetical protein